MSTLIITDSKNEVSREANRLERLGEFTGKVVIKTADLSVRTVKATHAGGASFVRGFMNAWRQKS